MIRIPAVRGAGTRIEIRNVDPTANPYLALACIINAGLDGILNPKKCPPVEPVYDNIFSLTREQREAKGIPNLPENLKDAIKELKKDKENIVDDINYVKYYPKTYKYYSLFPNKDSDNEEMIKKREKMKQKIKFFLNGKKNKRHENNDENKEVEKNINEEDNESDSIKENEDNIKEKEKNKEKNKNNENKSDKRNEKRKEKEKEKNNSGQDYESFKKKKIFK